MRLVLQRVKKGSVTIEGQIRGQIEEGYVVLVGFGQNDDEQILDPMIDKMINLRVFSDENGKMNRSLLDVGGSILSISQFTLYADCRHGRRPGFTQASRPDVATKLYDLFNEKVEKLGVKLEKGEFGADMLVEIANDGPVTIILDSEIDLAKKR